MLARFRHDARMFGLALRGILIGLMATVMGCDREVGWRGVGTDRRDADPPSGKPATGGEVRDVTSR